MPLSQSAAVAAGWSQVGHGCDPVFGLRFRKSPALAPTMIYDARGQVAGMQWGVNTSTYPTAPCSSIGGPFWHETDPSVISTTVYFSDPSAGLCDSNARPVLPAGSKVSLTRPQPTSPTFIPLNP